MSAEKMRPAFRRENLKKNSKKTPGRIQFDRGMEKLQSCRRQTYKASDIRASPARDQSAGCQRSYARIAIDALLKTCSGPMSQDAPALLFVPVR